MKDIIRKLFAHGAIVISGMYIVFFFIDRVNSAMEFIDNGITKVLLVVLGLLSIFNAIQVIAEDRKRQRRRMRKMKKREKSGLE